MKYDLIVFGGGTSGIACAYIAAKKGLNTLLVEKTDVLGGAITQGLVIPSMKTDTQNINTEFFNDLKVFADKYNKARNHVPLPSLRHQLKYTEHYRLREADRR